MNYKYLVVECTVWLDGNLTDNVADTVVAAVVVVAAVAVYADDIVGIVGVEHMRLVGGGFVVVEVAPALVAAIVDVFAVAVAAAAAAAAAVALGVYEHLEGWLLAVRFDFAVQAESLFACLNECCDHVRT